MSLVSYAKSELERAGLFDKDSDYGGMLGEAVLKMIEQFSQEGHSGMSANLAISIFEKLARFEPLSPLTGEDDEWMEINEGLYQNVRCGHVFKENDKAYDIQGIVFYEWCTNEEGEKWKSHFTSSKSRTPVTFPYVPTTVYQEYVEDDQNKSI